MALRVLVTGATGLIGTKLLTSNSAVEYVPLKRVDLLEKDAENFVVGQCKKFNCSIVLNLAWVTNSIKDYRNSEVNHAWQEFSNKLSKLCFTEDICYAGLGSVAEIESEIKDAYALAKRNHFKFLVSELSLNNAIWFRPFYIFDIDELKPNILNFLHKNHVPTRVNFPENAHDYVMTSDVVSAIDLALSKQLRGTIEIGLGKLSTNRELIQKICEMKNIPMPIMNQKITYQQSQPFASIQKLLDNGWTPKYTQAFFSSKGARN